MAFVMKPTYNRWPIMAFVMKPTYNVWSAAHHTRLLILAPKG